MTSHESSARRPRLPATVFALGTASFFTDVGSEMIFPLLPVFVASLGATPAFLGLVEGLADALSSLLKLATGYVSDRLPRKKGLLILGYGIASVVRPLMGAALVPWHVLAVRLTDRIGKGIRAAPRDALISNAVPNEQAGRAFGLHRAMDHGGAVVGPLVATLLLGAGVPVRDVFYAAIVPGLLALLAFAWVREDKSPVAAAAAEPNQATARSELVSAGRVLSSPGHVLPYQFYGYMAVLALFALGNSSDAFLLLRAGELGVPTALLPVLWTVLHVSKLAFSYLGGVLADAYSRPRLLVAGWTVYGLVYLGLAYATETWQVWALFLLYGLFYGLTEPTEKTLVKDLAPAHAQGRAFGFYNFVIGLCAVPAGLLTGYVWQSVSPQAALTVGAAIAGAASVALSAYFGALRRR